MNKTQPKVAIVICNWNKKEYVLNCITSVRKLNYSNYDIIVVDNASIDGSVQAIKKQFPDQFIIENEYNKGGSGGFNTGIRYALDKQIYKYIYLLDNDVIVDKDALISLVEEMEADENMAIAGSKIYIMDEPNRIQELGAFIDWEQANILLNKNFLLEEEPITDNQVVDYVAACSLIVRVQAVEKVGLMNEEYFLYYDDIDWAQRIHLAGYSIKAIAKSKVWHKGGGTIKTSTLPNYYWCRNGGYFFNKYLPDEKWELVMKNWLIRYFHRIYTCEIYGKLNTAKSFYSAIQDIVHNIRGKVDQTLFKQAEKPQEFSVDDLKHKKVYVVQNSYTPKVSLMLKTFASDFTYQEWNPNQCDRERVLLVPCDHVLTNEEIIDIKDMDVYWIDRYSNILPQGEKGISMRATYQNKMKDFQENYMDELLKKLKKVRVANQ